MIGKMSEDVDVRVYPPLEVLELSGSPHQRGKKYGEACKTMIEEQITHLYSSFREKRRWLKEKVLGEARKYVPFIEEYSPEIADEMKGMAAGAEVGYEDIAALIAHYELGEDVPSCTCFAATGQATVQGETYIGQNWDGGPGVWWEGEESLLLRVIRPSGPNVLTFVDKGFPAGYGMNSDGIAVVWNSVHCDESQLGVPTYLIPREVLHQKTIGDAIGAVFRARRAESFNFVIADENGEVYNIEATPNNIDITHADKYMGHANHFTKLKVGRDLLLEQAFNVGMSTLIRHNRINRLLSQKCGCMDLEALVEMLKDHVNYPNSICCHQRNSEGKVTALTFSSAVMVPAKREMYITHGNPCRNKFYKHAL
jgi:isopenicillin-N N-acyltransferase-like protein